MMYFEFTRAFREEMMYYYHLENDESPKSFGLRYGKSSIRRKRNIQKKKILKYRKR